MPAQRIDFRYVRQHADFPKVLAAYGITLEKDGARPGQFKGLCPFHDDQKPSLKINTERNIYNCFPCGAGGNVLEFVMEYDECDLRAAAKTVADLSGIPYSDGSAPPATAVRRVAPRRRDVATSLPMTPTPANDVAAAGNPVLTFVLKNLVTEHPFIASRGLTPAMIETFGLGIATRGIMKDRLVFPIHNANGELVAYCGRYASDEPPEDEPKYKQPPNFRKERELYNWHRAKERLSATRPVVVVESFFSTIKLHVATDYPVVSPMGRSLSDDQLMLLKAGGVRRIMLLFDGDDPGRAAVTTVGRQLLAAKLEVTAPVVPEDFKPHRATAEDLKALLTSGVVTFPP